MGFGLQTPPDPARKSEPRRRQRMRAHLRRSGGFSFCGEGGQKKSLEVCCARPRMFMGAAASRAHRKGAEPVGSSNSVPDIDECGRSDVSKTTLLCAEEQCREGGTYGGERCVFRYTIAQDASNRFLLPRMYLEGVPGFSTRDVEMAARRTGQELPGMSGAWMRTSDQAAVISLPLASRPRAVSPESARATMVTVKARTAG